MKIIFFFLFTLTQNTWAASSDAINLSSSIDPYCEVEFNAQPIASNLDITTSQSDLYIGDVIIRANTAGSAWNTPHTIDISGTLTHSNNVNTFSLGSSFDVVAMGGRWPRIRQSTFWCNRFSR